MPIAHLAHGLRKHPLQLRAMSGAETAQHFVALSRLDSVGGACTMSATPPPFLARHPAAPDDISQGFLACLFELQEMLRAASGMADVSLAPRTEQQSVFACMAMLRAFHATRGDTARSELVSARAKAVYVEAAAMCGYTLRELPGDAAALHAHVGPQTAALLLAQDCTVDIKAIVQASGGLLLGCVSADNLAIARGMDALGVSMPQAGGMPDAWAVVVSQPLAHFLPLPVVARGKDVYRMLGEKDLSLSIGRLGGTVDSAALLSAYLRAVTAKK